jgi:WXG100 family type VII secretion target
MPGSKVRADYDELEKIAQTFQRESDKVHRTLGDLHGQLDVLMDGDWVGRGATEFYREMISEVLPSVKRLEDSLQNAARVTRQISRRMKQAEEDSARLFHLDGNGKAAPASSALKQVEAPFAEAQQQQQQNPWATVYTVQPGDTLLGIAVRFGLNPWTIILANQEIDPNFNPHLVFPDQQLVIPTGGPRPDFPHFGQYTVQPGENWFAIAARFGVPLADLYRANFVVNPGLTPPGTVNIPIRPENLNTSQYLYALAPWLTEHHPELVQQHMQPGEQFDPDDRCTESTATCRAALAAGLEWQNTFNDEIVAAFGQGGSWGNRPDLQATLSHILKRQILNEGQFTTDAVTGPEQGTGLVQVTPGTLDTLINSGYLPALPAGVTADDYLKNPQNAIVAASANLRYLYDNIQEQNETNNWNMSEQDALKLTVALYNTGPGTDFGTEYRQGVANGDFNASCTDAGSWACIAPIFPQMTQDYVNNIFGPIDAPPR